MKYKVGDKVKIKSLDWYNENKNERGEIQFKNNPHWRFVKNMSEKCGKISTIIAVSETAYRLENIPWNWTDEMIERLVEEEITQESLKSRICECENFFICPDGYEFHDENGNVIEAKKIILEKKKKEYPKTYEECCKILGDVRSACWSGYKCDILGYLNKLLICRDAYWKLYGEEMGLGKPWEPDYTEESYEHGSPIKYVIYYTGTHITKGRKCTPHYILSFPTAEMRDAFYENFEEEMENCKELL